ncbi:hypothetical protein AOLI_G00088650 [Acnodon oligacanthus]
MAVRHPRVPPPPSVFSFDSDSFIGLLCPREAPGWRAAVVFTQGALCLRGSAGLSAKFLPLAAPKPTVFGKHPGHALRTVASSDPTSQTTTIDSAAGFCRREDAVENNDGGTLTSKQSCGKPLFVEGGQQISRPGMRIEDRRLEGVGDADFCSGEDDRFSALPDDEVQKRHRSQGREYPIENF